MGKTIELLTPHAMYQSLGKTLEERLQAYRSMFRGRMAEKTLEEVRQATNKSWVLVGRDIGFTSSC